MKSTLICCFILWASVQSLRLNHDVEATNGLVQRDWNVALHMKRTTNTHFLASGNISGNNTRNRLLIFQKLKSGRLSLHSRIFADELPDYNKTKRYFEGCDIIEENGVLRVSITFGPYKTQKNGLLQGHATVGTYTNGSWSFDPRPGRILHESISLSNYFEPVVEISGISDTLFLGKDRILVSCHACIGPQLFMFTFNGTTWNLGNAWNVVVQNSQLLRFMARSSHAIILGIQQGTNSSTRMPISAYMMKRLGPSFDAQPYGASIPLPQPSYFGYGIDSIDAKGDLLVTGQGRDGISFARGVIGVYQWNNNGSYQLIQTILGNQSQDLGQRVRLSSTGKHLMASAFTYDHIGYLNTGRGVLYQNIDGMFRAVQQLELPTVNQRNHAWVGNRALDFIGEDHVLISANLFTGTESLRQLGGGTFLIFRIASNASPLPKPSPIIRTKTSSMFVDDSPSQRVEAVDTCTGVSKANGSISFSIASIEEVNPANVVVQALYLRDHVFQHRVFGNGTSKHFQTNSVGDMNIDWMYLETKRNQSFANRSFVVDKDTAKFTFRISKWPFLSTGNRFRLGFTLDSDLPIRNRSLLPRNQSTDPLQWIISTSSATIKVSFFDVAEVDGRVVPVPITWSNGSTMIQLDFPWFGSLLYDPDFSVLFSGTNGECGTNGTDDIWMYLLAGSVVVVVVLVTGMGIGFSKRCGSNGEAEARESMIMVE